MTDLLAPHKHFVQEEFHFGRVLNRTLSVLSHNVLQFSLVTGIASLPSVLIFTPRAGFARSGHVTAWFFLGVVLSTVLNALSQAIVLYGAFEDMRGRPVNLIESMKIGLRRLFPVIGVALGASLLAVLAGILLVIPAFIVITMLFVAMPVCIVEQLGPWNSMGRSADLTKGHRWKIFWLWLVTLLVGGIIGAVLDRLAGLGGLTLVLTEKLVWSAVWSAFYAILAVVTYHDLRVAKEGVDTDQIAAVFD